MAVLIYQIGIFLAIQIASFFGKSARNTAIILIVLFTLLQVFMSWLLVLQLITIFISYRVSRYWFPQKKHSKVEFTDAMFTNYNRSKNAISNTKQNLSHNTVTLKSKFYYIDHAKEYGPVTAKKLLRLVRKKKIKSSCFVRTTNTNTYDMRAQDVVDLLG